MPDGLMNVYKIQFAMDRMKIALAQPLTTLPDYGTNDAVVPHEDKLDELVSELQAITNELR